MGEGNSLSGAALLFNKRIFLESNHSNSSVNDFFKLKTIKFMDYFLFTILKLSNSVHLFHPIMCSLCYVSLPLISTFLITTHLIDHVCVRLVDAEFI